MANSTAADVCETLALPSTDDLVACSDNDLQQRQRDFAAVRRLVDSGAARVSAELARRSARELGYSGLAQREALRAAEQLIEKLAGVTPGEARAMVRVGELLDDPSVMPSVSRAVAAGDLSVLAADAIRSGLGEPTDDLPASTIADAAELMVDIAINLPVRKVAAQARALRDTLDMAGVAEREEQLRSHRFLRLVQQADGMTRLTGLLDPESAAIVTAAFDQVTSPRRGGPRFVDAREVERARLISEDPRTTDQLLADAFVEMVRIAGAADQGTVFGQRRPAVSLHVEREDFESGLGSARIEGQSVAVSIETARRQACSSGVVPILFDGEDALDVGRTQRLFTDRQRVALAARDGGCRFPDCDRPPSWCEAHHIDEWVRDNGRTDVAAGVLLCRFHHLLVHNAGWRIRRRGGGFAAAPPPGRNGPDLDMPSQHPRPPRAA
ncbi:MAG: DUF222 domain-containing protein [Pseudolysinimonas sp.]